MKDLDSEELAQKAIKSLELAGNYESEDDIEKAIEIYQEALKNLIESGYLPHRNNDIQDHIDELIQSLEDKERSKRLGVSKERDKLQKEAFILIEQAEKMESEGTFQKAIKKYELAIPLLEESGWIGSQLQHLWEKIKSLNVNLDKEEVVRKQKAVRYTDQKQIKPTIVGATQDFQTLQESYVDTKNEQESIRDEAFRLIDIANELDKNEKYDDAMDQINQAIDLFKSINWGSHIQPFNELLSQIKERRDMKIAERQRRKLQEEKLHEIKESIDHKSNDTLDTTSQQQFQRLEAYEHSKKEEKQKEEEFFELLEKADHLINYEEFDAAIAEYNKTLNLLNKMGKGWEYYIPTIQNTIITINTKKESYVNIEIQQKKQQEELLKQNQEFQEFVSKKLNVDRRALENRELVLREGKKEKEYFEKRKELAFNYLNSAQNYVKTGELDNAILAYQNASSIFDEINWGEEIDLIQSSIHDLEEKKRELDGFKNRQMEEKIRKLKEEEEFQKRINEQMTIERKKIQQKEVQLREREKIIEVQEFKKDNALNLLEQAQGFLEIGDFDNALSLYSKSKLILTQVNYPTNIVDEMIFKVQEQKRINQIEHQKNFELQQKREIEDREFQQRITKNIDSEKIKLKEKQIRIHKYEERKQLIEQKRQEAFNLLDEAENLVHNVQYDQAIRYYRKAQRLLNQIQFPTNSLEDSVNKIIKLKEQKEKEKQLSYQKELQKLEQDKSLNLLIRERKRKERAQILNENLVRIEREEILQKQMSQRDTAYSLLEKATDYLNLIPPDYKKAISLYLEARDFLATNIRWEPEISKINQLINEVRKDETNYINKKNRERFIEAKKQKEHTQYLEEVERRKLELKKKELDKAVKLREYVQQQEKLNQLQIEAFEYIDKGKHSATQYYFEESYNYFNKAIQTFKNLGWNEQIKFIELEIKNVKELEEKVHKVEISRKLMTKQLEEQKIFEEYEKSKTHKIIKDTVNQVSNFSEHASKSIENELISVKMKNESEKKKIKEDAKIFGKSMKKLISLKEDLLQKIKESKDAKLKEKERLENEKEKENIDEIKKMLKETMKKKKKIL
ncbi:MAG: hypothetical protein KGD63_03670 [Candidatus Lokiarchaeota archaeon]|nr:hypothetical protein [Candidatus Lokiarchaeota archaeon]